MSERRRREGAGDSAIGARGTGLSSRRLVTFEFQEDAGSAAGALDRASDAALQLACMRPRWVLPLARPRRRLGSEPAAAAHCRLSLSRIKASLTPECRSDLNPPRLSGRSHIFYNHRNIENRAARSFCDGQRSVHTLRVEI